MSASPIHHFRPILLALVLPVLAACGGGGDDEGNITPPIDVSPLPPPPSPAPTCAELAAAAASAAQSGASSPAPGWVPPPFDPSRCLAK